jgi:hypothetical protein
LALGMEISVALQVIIVLESFFFLAISGNTSQYLNMQPTDVSTMINILQQKNYVFHVFMATFTGIPWNHISMTQIELKKKITCNVGPWLK